MSSPSATQLFVRAPHLAVSWERGRLSVIDGVSGLAFGVSESLLHVLDCAGSPATMSDLAQRAEVSIDVVTAMIDTNVLLVPFEEPEGDDYWSTFELIVQRIGGGVGQRPQVDWDRMPPIRRGAWGEQALPLPHLGPLPSASFGEVLTTRRSHRDFAEGEHLTVEELGSFLALSASVQRAFPASGMSLRPYPSAGGRHPLEIHLAVLAVQDLPRAAYWYDPFDHSLCQLDSDTAYLEKIRGRIHESLGGELTGDPGVVVVLTAVFARSMWKYHSGLGLVYRDVGCLLQTFYLVATALGLAGCAAQITGEMSTARWLGLDPLEESEVGCFVLGRPA